MPIKREDASKPDLFVEMIDFENTERNIFKVVNQLEIKGTQKRIPDGIMYVNGLPVVVLEFKSAVKTDATIMNAYTQLTVRYRRDIPNLFRYNAFVVISDGVNNKYGTLFTPRNKVSAICNHNREYYNIICHTSINIRDLQ